MGAAANSPGAAKQSQLPGVLVRKTLRQLGPRRIYSEASPMVRKRAVVVFADFVIWGERNEKSRECFCSKFSF